MSNSFALPPRASSETGGYDRVRDRSLRDRDAFWLEQAEALTWHQRPRTALEQRDEHSWRWYPDGELNLSENALDRHVDAGRGEHTALISDSAMTGERASLSYRELRDRVAAFAGALVEQGVTRGDRVLIYLPMIPEAVIAMLACARIGAIHSVVFGGFAARELAVRIDDATPAVIVTASGGLEPNRVVEYLPLVSRALELSRSGSVRSVIVHARPQVPGTAAEFAGHGGATWLDWAAAEAAATPAAPVPVNAGDPLYILYTSGTTGSPKGVLRDTGGYAVALSWAMANIYRIGVGDTILTASDVGWVVGHSFIVYGPLLAGATTVIYEGKPVGTPDAAEFWRLIERHRVNVLNTAPTAMRAIRREDPELSGRAGIDLSSLEAVYLAGERLDPETWRWASEGLGVPVIDHWWQTESGWPICANPRGLEDLPAKIGSTSVPMPGFDVRVLDRAGEPVETPDEEGILAIRLPLPPGALVGIWGSEERFRSAYLSDYPGYYSSGDAGYRDADGYVFVMGRTDDVINVAGHRLSTGSLEEALGQHPAIAECAVLGVRDELKGQRAAGFVTLKHGRDDDVTTLSAELVALVRDQIGPVAAFRDVIVVERLPKTRSGKILRKTLRQIVDGDEVHVPPTIEDLSVLDQLREAVQASR